MPNDQFFKLDNPAWYSLAETHRHFAINKPGIKRYRQDIVSFLAFDHSKPEALYLLDQLAAPDESFFIIGNLPPLPANYSIVTQLPCEQMICSELINTPTATATIEKLDDANEAQMLSLINLVQPGYFLPGTRLMGDYVGIRHNGELVAMAGERMKMSGLTEISAVVTHPAFTGRQYAQQLVAHIVRKNIEAGIIPFLHVAATNERAIAIYKKLGFDRRRIIDFWKIKREK
ncbi:GNAT family N-acetyltransferase [Terrimonas pollutisoli]|uniref:GNAT family N-acetyltransferase n=1 Tax=Terrimonas pollutisoli TaxID=3034147 RepID=UPI0023EB6C7F|nr:GNAT family N-acetyltransferase [Terrimonas sp. H1YJ31]